MGQVTATVDFGTSHTVAVVSGPGLAARLVTVDGQPWFPSAVFWTSRGDAVVGGDALRLARAEPARLEPRPKSRIGESDVLLSDAVVPTATLVRAVLARVVGAATGTAGAPVQHLVLTHPANWGSTRIGALLAAAIAGLLASPVSWSHHWVWAMLAGVWIVPRLREWQWPGRIVAVVGLLVFVTPPHWVLPNRHDREMDWAWWQHIVGNEFTLFGLALLIVLARPTAVLLSRRRTPAAAQGREQPS